MTNIKTIFENIIIITLNNNKDTKIQTVNIEVNIKMHKERPISVELPKQINCKIKTTDASIKGQTVSSSYKPAVLENNLNVQVPPFIEIGDEIIIDSRSLEYIKKV